ncbi:glycoside hydrolase family 5 protein [Pelagibius litoralis]|uniref:Glycoside hydrolase family 5 protein n=1 Tax=Pelagibius litoralis TaxID=374515 RepID=A0A967F294_9PROT|nr:cellulase family glycosylhydrolase [Pelagibius litoralis]NIA71853.1 glycoside hydrolase family 5 protein [Pelagibius litoralis]
MRVLRSGFRNLFAGFCLAFCFAGAAAAADISFWDNTRTGANAFNQVQTEEWFAAADETGLSWVRLAFAKWESRERDFLMGDADRYEGLVKADLARLLQALDWAEAQGQKVVIAPLSLPGARWRQNNDGRIDDRLWRDRAYWEQAKAYWRDLAKALADHPAVAAYNILNEPRPELGTGLAEHGAPGDIARFDDWYAAHRGTPADLYAFYQEVIAAIRAVDPSTPVMVDSGLYAQPGAFAYWPGPLEDDKVLYAFHVYEPYEFTAGSNYRKKKGFTYPGKVPYGDGTYHWDKAQLARYLSPVFDWADKHGIPPERIVASEFGCMRRNEGCREWLGDVIDLFDERQIHWAFYSFREDEWDGYDYEVGSVNLPWAYWQAVERGETPEIPRKNTPLFEAIRSRLK